MSFCYCGSQIPFAHCCEPILKGQKKAETAEALMRSRYTAYAVGNIPYLIQSTHLSQRNQYSPSSMKKWAQSSTWIRLEILSTTQGQEVDTVGEVEFKAHFLDDKKNPCIHLEYSTFVKKEGRWYFLKGEVK